MYTEKANDYTNRAVVPGDTARIMAAVNITSKPVWADVAIQRLRQLGLTRADLIKPLGVETIGAVSHYFTGRRELSAGQLQSMATLLQLRLDELMGNSGNTGAAPSRITEVPLISWVQAGAPNPVQDLYNVGDGERIVYNTKRLGPHAFALRVKGQSMENPRGKPTYPDGSIILVDPDRQHFNGAPVIVRLENSLEATFKIYEEDAGRKLLKPLNPQYPTIEIKDNATFVGVVVQTIINED